MQALFYPGSDRQPCKLQYGICMAPKEGAGAVRSVIVYLRAESSANTSLMNSDEARNHVINRILENDLRGIRLEWIRFIYDFVDSTDGRHHAFEFPFDVDLDDYESRGNPLSVEPLENVVTTFVKELFGRKSARRISVLTYHLVAGSAKVYSNFNERMGVDKELLQTVCQELGVSGPK